MIHRGFTHTASICHDPLCNFFRGGCPHYKPHHFSAHFSGHYNSPPTGSFWVLNWKKNAYLVSSPQAKNSRNITTSAWYTEASPILLVFVMTPSAIFLEGGARIISPTTFLPILVGTLTAPQPVLLEFRRDGLALPPMDPQVDPPGTSEVTPRRDPVPPPPSDALLIMCAGKQSRYNREVLKVLMFLDSDPKTWRLG